MNRRHAMAAGVAAGVLAVDLATKRLAAIELQGERLPLIEGFLELTYTENPGGAFSMFPEGGTFLGIAAILISLFVVWLVGRSESVVEVVALGLVLGGALGNLADRVFRGDGLLDGAVIDWVSLWWIPTFNVADASVTVAVAILLVHSWMTPSS